MCAPGVNSIQQICRGDDCERPAQGASCLVDRWWLNGDVIHLLLKCCGGVTSAGRQRLLLNEVGAARVCVLVKGQWLLASRLAQCDRHGGLPDWGQSQVQSLLAKVGDSVVDLFLMPVNLGNQHWYLLVANIRSGRVQVHVHDSGPTDSSTSVGRRRRREARGFTKNLQQFLSSSATMSSRPPAPAAIETLHVCLSLKQTDFFSCGVYTCWVVLCETVALELGAQWCPGFECVSQDVPTSDLLLLRHFIAQMLMDPIKAQTLTRFMQTSAGMVAHPEGSGGTVRNSDALSSRASADPPDLLVVADPAPCTPVATQPTATAPPAGRCSPGDLILDYFQLLQVLRSAGKAAGRAAGALAGAARAVVAATKCDLPALGGAAGDSLPSLTLAAAHQLGACDGPGSTSIPTVVAAAS